MHSFILLTLLLASFSSAVTISGAFSHNVTPDDLRGCRVVVNNGENGEVIPRFNGEFSLELEEGLYVLEVVSIKYTFPQIYVNVAGTVSYEAYDVGTGAKRPLARLLLEPTAKRDYFEIRPPFDIASFLKNPMIIMVLVTVGMLVCMNQVMSSVDPEQMKEMQGDDGNLGTPPEETLQEIDDIARSLH